jgi:hypothetical protein
METSSQGPARRQLRHRLPYIGFALILLLAVAPAWRVLVFNLTIDDLLQLRCF